MLLVVQGQGRAVCILLSCTAAACLCDVYAHTCRCRCVSVHDQGLVGAGLALGKGGSVELRGVSFRYPARPEVQVFRHFSLTVAPGRSLALVGQSGSGKSTVISLIQRFYDVEAGQVSPMHTLLHLGRASILLVYCHIVTVLATVAASMLC